MLQIFKKQIKKQQKFYNYTYYFIMFCVSINDYKLKYIT